MFDVCCGLCVVCCVVRRHIALCGLSLVLGIGTGNGWMDGRKDGVEMVMMRRWCCGWVTCLNS